jgi:serine/threonine protein kinase
VKLFDFGTAVPMDQKGALVGEKDKVPDYLTLEYASPEVVRGNNISTLSDQYSLGVILYELLTGRRPFNVADKMSAEIYRIICEEAPPVPSRIIRETSEMVNKDGRRLVITQDQICEVRRATPSALARTLRGDIDQVLLMTLRKEPERRYQSVESFASDLERYLEKRPLIAKKDSLVYGFSKFARRRPFILLAILLVIWGVIVAFLTTYRSPGKTETLFVQYLRYCDASSRYLSAVKIALEGDKGEGGKDHSSMSKAVDEIRGENCR